MAVLRRVISILGMISLAAGCFIIWRLLFHSETIYVLVKMTGNASDWLSYAGGALIYILYFTQSISLNPYIIWHKRYKD